MKITDKDIATISTLHDALLGSGFPLSSPRLVAARELTFRMYKELETKTYTESDLDDAYDKGIADAIRYRTNLECDRPITFKISKELNTLSKETEDRVNKIK
jgi:hypothetical protein